MVCSVSETTWKHHFGLINLRYVHVFRSQLKVDTLGPENRRRIVKMKLTAFLNNDDSNIQRDLRILDEWSPDDSESDGSDESTGVDPYNSGSIDPSKSWKSRSRK